LLYDTSFSNIKIIGAQKTPPFSIFSKQTEKSSGASSTSVLCVLMWEKFAIIFPDNNLTLHEQVLFTVMGKCHKKYCDNRLPQDKHIVKYWVCKV